MGDGPFWLIVAAFSAIMGIIFSQMSFLKLSLLFFVGFTIAQWIFLPFKLLVKRRRPYANTELQGKVRQMGFSFLATSL